MNIYMGYGFDVSELLSKKNIYAVFDFIKKYDNPLYVRIHNKIMDGTKDAIQEVIRQDNWESIAEYIKTMVNIEEQNYSGTCEDILENYHGYLVFTPTEFLDERQCALYMRNPKMFQNMIFRYFPVESLKFGSLYANGCSNNYYIKSNVCININV